MEIIQHKMKEFIGNNHYYKFCHNGVTKQYTEGVKRLTKKLKSDWWVNTILSWNSSSFGIWGIEGRQNNTVVVTMREDEYHKPKVKLEIWGNNFQADNKIKLYMENGILMLPSEY